MKNPNQPHPPIRRAARFFVAFALLVFSAAALAPMDVRAQTYTVLNDFAEATGSLPAGGLTPDGTVLYGVTTFGGDNGDGAIFTINTDGSGFLNLHHFSGAADGTFPNSDLVLNSGVLYGTTGGGGANGGGTIFKVNVDGSTFMDGETLNVLKHFADPSISTAGLVTDGTYLYGTTTTGGANSAGALFRIEKTGMNFTVLHNFGGTDDGVESRGRLLLEGGVLYGVTGLGGKSALGTAFMYDTSNSSYTKLKDFAGGTSDGALPSAELLLSGGTLYGTTLAGGSADFGVVFKINTDGKSFSILQSLGVGLSDPAQAEGRLVLHGGTLYGTGQVGGANGSGAVFKVNPDGTGFSVFKSFDLQVDDFIDDPPFDQDGDTPAGSLLLHNGTLYGAGGFGGSANGGVLYSLTLPAAASDNADLSNLVLSDGSLAPAFAAETTAYTATVPNATGSITVTPTADDATATIKVNNTPVATGAASGSITLNVGANVITTVVTAQDGATTKTYTVTVTRAKADQTITFAPLSARAFDNSPFSVNASGGNSGNPVTFSIVSEPANATIDGNAVTLTGVGTVTVRASQAGNANYNAAMAVDQSFTVSKADQTITFGALPPRSFDNSPFTVNATGGDSGNPVTFSIVSEPANATVDGNTVTLTGAGLTHESNRRKE